MKDQKRPKLNIQSAKTNSAHHPQHAIPKVAEDGGSIMLRGGFNLARLLSQWFRGSDLGD